MKNIISMGLVVILFSGCGELAYKRGASAQDLAAAKKGCQSAGSKESIDKCLEENGWLVQDLGTIGLPDSELFATATVTDDNRNLAQPSTSEDKVEKNDIDETVTAASDKRVIPKNANSNRKIEVKPAPNPFENYKINSWWKMGGNRDALEQSMVTCTDKLGEAHQPDRKQQFFTRAFAACMYENGWRGLRER